MRQQATLIGVVVTQGRGPSHELVIREDGLTGATERRVCDGLDVIDEALFHGAKTVVCRIPDVEIYFTKFCRALSALNIPD